VTVVWNADGKNWVMPGCAGTWKFTGKAGEVVTIEFTMTGLYITETDASIPSATYLSQQPAPFMSATLSIHSFTTAILASAEIDLGGKVEILDDANSANGVKGVQFVSREPSIAIEMGAEKLATFDAFGKMKSGAEATTSFVIGATAGNIITISMPKTQIIDVKPVNKNGLGFYQLKLQANQNTGDDWITITMT
jgi:hypothetical protein